MKIFYTINQYTWTMLHASFETYNELEGWLDYFSQEKISFHRGFELENKSGESLSIGITEDKWVLIHTKDKTRQHCSLEDPQISGVIEIQWEQSTEIPKRWFIAKSEAKKAIKFWIENGGMDPAINWSEQVY